MPAFHAHEKVISIVNSNFLRWIKMGWASRLRLKILPKRPTEGLQRMSILIHTKDIGWDSSTGLLVTRYARNS